MRKSSGLLKWFQSNPQPRVIPVVVLSQFLAAFCALGMAPFFSVLVGKLLKIDALDHSVLRVFSVGVLFYFPSFCGALVSPLWGKLADTLGQKRLLLRAQLGLVLSFGVAGYSTHLWHFVLALLLQGFFGGTFAASRSYLATQLNASQLAESLTWMETAPRLAWFLAPAVIGWILPEQYPVTIYKYLLFLPLLSLILTAFLPAEKFRNQSKDRGSKGHLGFEVKVSSFEGAFLGLLGVQFLLGFASGMVTPYFTAFLLHRHTSLSLVGAIFGLPSLIYLLLAVPLGRALKGWLENHSPVLLIQGAFFFQALCLLGQVFSQGPLWVVFWRAATGLSLTLNLIALHSWIAQTKSMNGVAFGWLESASRVSGLLGGLVAGLGVARYSVEVPFYLAASIFGLGGVGLGVGSFFLRKEGDGYVGKLVY